jgi:site-specific DNA-methyltransferase (adenine-specific)
MLEINKIHNGNCLDLMKEIEDNSIDSIICDLPYGTTACSWDVIIPFEDLWNQYKRIIKKDGAIVLFGSEPFSTLLRMSNLENFKYDWIWEKQKASNFMGAKYQPLKYHEIISVFSYGTHYYNPQRYKVLEIEDIFSMNKEQIVSLFDNRDYDRYGKIDRRKTVNDPKTNKDLVGIDIQRTRSEDDGYRYPKSVLKINKDINSNFHPTQKPVKLIEYLVKTYSKEGDLILDNCSGSGSLAVACYNTKRNFICIEKDENYYKQSLERLNKAKVKKRLF